MMNFEYTSKYKKEYATLAKRYQSLNTDLEKLKNTLRANPIPPGDKFNILHTLPIPTVKAQLSCETLRRGSKGSLRIIYAYWEKDNKFVFIRLYCKGDKKSKTDERINHKRIQEYLDSIQT